MLLALFTSVVLSQQPELRSPIGVVLTSRRPNTEAFSPKIAARVVEFLKREGLAPVLEDAKTVKELKNAGVADSRACNGGQACTAKLAVLLGPRAVIVGIDVGKVGKSLAIHLEAFAADLPEPLAVADVSAREEKWADQAVADFTFFARQLKERLTVSPGAVAAADPVKPAEPRRVDAPVARPLEPTPEDPGDLRDVGAPSAPRVPAIVVASAAGAAAVVTGIFGVLTMIDRSAWNQNVTTLPDGSMGSMTMTAAQLKSLSDSVNGRATVTLLSGLVTLALSGVATWLFIR